MGLSRVMRTGCRAIAGWLALSFVGSAWAQSAAGAAASPEGMRVIAAPEGSIDPGGSVLREIEDPATGDLWLLVRDPSRPAGPGRLVLARQRSSSQEKKDHDPALPAPAGERPLIHTGDALIVEEHTAVVDTRLEGVALGPAVAGAYFRARLKIGGKVVRVEAVSPGHAVFGPESKVEP